MCASLFANVEKLLISEIISLDEKSVKSGTVCCENVWHKDDSDSPNLSLVMHVHAVISLLSLVCVVNKTFSTWKLRLSGDVEENPGPDPALNQSQNGGGPHGNGNKSCPTMASGMDELLS